MNAQEQSNSAFQAGRRSSFGASGVTPFPIANRRIVLSTNSTKWVNELSHRFNEITSLERGWDGYRGVPVSFTCATFAARLLERICVDDVTAPSLVPGCDGTMQIEWHKNQYDVEIDVLGPNNVVAMRYDRLTDTVECRELETDFSILVNWIDDLATPRLQEMANQA